MSARRASRIKYVGLFLVLAAFLAFAGTGSAVVNTYFGPEWYAQWAVANESGYNYPDWNRVYRPVGYEFALWYQYGSFVYQYEENTWSNPFWHNQAGGYRKSVCKNQNVYQVTVYPTTCQYGT